MIIPYGHQDIDENDIEAVNALLRSDFLTTGPVGPQFEDELCAVTNAKYAVAVSSGTAALHLAMLALNIKAGDVVYVAAISFAASANCARYVGAEVEFIDVDAAGLISIPHLEEKLQAAAKAHKLPAAVVAVDLAGRPCDLNNLARLKDQYGFHLIDDASHALGATYQGIPTGGSLIPDITVLSFHPVKIITTAEGGAALTHDAKLAQRLRLLRSHGIEHDPARLEEPGHPGYYYEMQELGFNYRLSDLQSALGLSQLTRMQEFLEKRRDLAARYLNELTPLQENSLIALPPADSEENISAWHLFQIRVKQGRRDALYQSLRSRQIGVQVHYLPIYAQPYYRKRYGEQHLPGADSFAAETLSLPLYPALSTLNFSYVTAQLLAQLDRLAAAGS